MGDATFRLNWWGVEESNLSPNHSTCLRDRVYNPAWRKRPTGQLADSCCLEGIGLLCAPHVGRGQVARSNNNRRACYSSWGGRLGDARSAIKINLYEKGSSPPLAPPSPGRGRRVGDEGTGVAVTHHTLILARHLALTPTPLPRSGEGLSRAANTVETGGE